MKFTFYRVVLYLDSGVQTHNELELDLAEYVPDITDEKHGRHLALILINEWNRQASIGNPGYSRVVYRYFLV